MLHPLPKQVAPSGYRPSTGRRTQVSEDTLRSLFEGDTSKRPRRSGNTVATQSTMSQQQFELCELVLQRDAGMVTKEHARDKQALLKMIEYRSIELVEEEQYHRVQVFLHHRDGFDVLKRLFTMGPRNAASMVLSSSHLSPPRMATQRRSSSTSMQPESESRISIDLTSRLSPEHEDVINENSRLSERVRLLEKSLQKKRSQQGASVKSTRKQSIMSSLKTMLPHEVEAFKRQQIHEMEESETQSRLCVTELEASCREVLALRIENASLVRAVDNAKRTLIQTPFTSYRPKVPVEAANGEEYLRRWLLAETYSHYDDLLSNLQRWENDARNGIEDLATKTLSSVFDQVFGPPHYARCKALEARVVQLEASNHEYASSIHTIIANVKMEALVDDEVSSRAALVENEGDARNNLRMIMNQLSSVRNVESRVSSLRQELSRQQRRHKVEVLALHSQLPREGVHMSVVPYNAVSAHTVVDTTGVLSLRSPQKPANEPQEKARPVAARSTEYWAGF